MNLTRRTFLKSGATLAALAVMPVGLLAESLPEVTAPLPLGSIQLDPDQIYTFSVYVREGTGINFGPPNASGVHPERGEWTGFQFDPEVFLQNVDVGNGWKHLSVTAAGKYIKKMSLRGPENAVRRVLEIHYPMLEFGTPPPGYIETTRQEILPPSWLNVEPVRTNLLTTASYKATASYEVFG